MAKIPQGEWSAIAERYSQGRIHFEYCAALRLYRARHSLHS
jgi:hypothetical protein